MTGIAEEERIARQIALGLVRAFGEMGETALTEVTLANGRRAVLTASNTGLLLYQAGSHNDQNRLTWYDRTGKQTSTVGEPGDYGSVALSHDGKQAAVTVIEGGNDDVWIFDVVRNLRSRFTFDVKIGRAHV